MNTIQSEWECFKENVIPKNANNIQINEMKKSFYAGAYAAISTMIKISAEDVSEEAGIEIFETMKNECELFGMSGGL